MPVELVGYLLLFVTVGVGFILVHLLVGKLVRPSRPDPEKLTIYECGEPTIGSAWVQFDLRFYVVALLFVIFDVEVAFFFPWAVVFGKTNELAGELAGDNIKPERRAQLIKDLTPYASPSAQDALTSDLQRRQELEAEKTGLLNAGRPDAAPRIGQIDEEVARIDKGLAARVNDSRKAANQFGWIAFIDILIFFGVLLVGFAYLWKRGDLEWVRSTAAERQGALGKEPLAETARREPLVTADSAAH